MEFEAIASSEKLDMNEAAAKIVRLQRRVMWRSRLLSLQDELAAAVAGGALIAAALVLLERLRPNGSPRWAIIIGVLSLSVATALTRWFLTRARLQDAAYLIDRSLKLDDRVATSTRIIELGGPKRALEEALIEDTAERVVNKSATSVLSFRMRRWYIASMVGLLALVGSLIIPARTLPVTQALAKERADIERAGERLEQTADEVEQAAPLGTETATLAKEQAEIGRGFRRSTATRAEALRRLSAVEERIRRRHDDLAATHADEIVSLADRRLGATIEALSTARRKTIEPDKRQLATTAKETAGASQREGSKESRVTPPSDGQKPPALPQQQGGKSGASGSQPKTPTKEDQTNQEAKAKELGKVDPRKQPQELVPGRDSKTGSDASDSSTHGSQPEQASVDKGKTSSDRKTSEAKPSDQRSSDTKTAGEKAGEPTTTDPKADNQPLGELPAGALDALKAVPNSVAEQAAKALPKMSEELLKKAVELRANELSPADIEKLRKAAESLSKDLAQIGQSKELQQALREMARQVRPQQIEQVAGALGDQEKLKQELDAAARLLSENQQAKEMVAGLAGQFARTRDEIRQQDNQRNGGNSAMRDEETRARDQSLSGTPPSKGQASRNQRTAADRQLEGRGSESSLHSKLQKGSGGEYLYLQTKAGVGAASAPYSSAYPQYRRKAERSVQRTQVPPNLRSVVRKYFDSINPDAKK